MGLRRLPVFETMVRTRQIRTPEASGKKSTVSKILDKTFLAYMADIPRFLNTYEIRDLAIDPPGGKVVEEDGGFYWDVGNELSMTTPPYPITWIEWQPPPTLIEDMVASNNWPSGRYRFAAWVMNGTEGRKLERSGPYLWGGELLPEGCDLDTSYQVALLILTPYRDDVALIPGIFCVGLDSEGNYLGHSGSISDNAERNHLGLAQDESLMLQLVWGAIQTLGWINCRNVATEDHQAEITTMERDKPTAPGKKGRKRKRRQFVTYRTVRLPGGAVEEGAGAEDHHSTSGTPVRLHKVRGHYKTFTQNHPLFGKYTGRYWWGWQMRGSAARGVSVSDYKMGPTSRQEAS